MSLLGIKRFLRSFCKFWGVTTLSHHPALLIDQVSPVDADEIILRRLAPAFYRGNPPDVHIEAFRPVRPNAAKNIEGDVDGLSVYREGCGTTPAMLLEQIPAEKRHSFAVARMRAGDLFAIGLTITSSPADLLGHAIIPELRWPAYEANKVACKEIAKQLAALASQNVVTIGGQ